MKQSKTKENKTKNKDTPKKPHQTLEHVLGAWRVLKNVIVAFVIV